MADNGQKGQSRLDRIEAIVEAIVSRQAVFEDEFSRLLRAQVLMVDAQQKTEQSLQALGENLQALAEAQLHTGENMQTLGENFRALDQKLQALAESQRHTDENLNALIAIVDDIVRKPPPPRD